MNALRVFLVFISIVYTSTSIAQTVYTTKTGEKYHKKSCSYLKYSKKEIKLKEAKERGYKACKVCKPISYKMLKTTLNSLANVTKSSGASLIKKVVATRCTGKTKSRTRCKRKTKSASGRCYQH